MMMTMMLEERWLYNATDFNDRGRDVSRL